MDRGMVLPQEPGTCRHGVNDEVDRLRAGDADLHKTRRLVRADEHGEIVEVEHSDRVSLGVQDVVVDDPVETSRSTLRGGTGCCRSFVSSTGGLADLSGRGVSVPFIGPADQPHFARDG